MEAIIPTLDGSQNQTLTQWIDPLLTVRPKISELSFRVFGRSLHPELFQTFATRQITREQYQLKIDITSSGHLLTWQRHGMVVSEVACSALQPLPATLQLMEETVAQPMARSLKHLDNLEYRCQFQLEPASPALFAMIQKELLKSVPCDGMLFQFESSGRMALGAVSYVNIQSRRNTVHIRAFHTFPDAYAVMKSESVFTVSESALF